MLGEAVAAARGAPLEYGGGEDRNDKGPVAGGSALHSFPTRDVNGILSLGHSDAAT